MLGHGTILHAFRNAEKMTSIPDIFKRLLLKMIEKKKQEGSDIEIPTLSSFLPD